MSLDDFLDDPFDDGEAGIFVDIVEVKIQTAWQGGYSRNERKFFPFNPSINRWAEQNLAKSECQQYITAHKIEAFPNLGFLITIPIDTHLTANEALTFDIEKFVNSYHSDKKQMGENGKLDKEQQALVKAPMPYDLVVNCLRDFPECFGNFAWARIAQEIDQFSVAKGKVNNKGYPYRVYVVKEIFASREMAEQAAALMSDTDNEEDNNSDDEMSSFTDTETADTKGLSKLARGTRWTIETLYDFYPTLLDDIVRAQAGINTPDEEPMSEYQAIVFVCENNAIEVDDFELITEMMEKEKPNVLTDDEVPF